MPSICLKSLKREIELIKIGAKVLRHSRYGIFQMEEVAIRKEIFAEILSRISRIRCCCLFENGRIELNKHSKIPGGNIGIFFADKNWECGTNILMNLKGVE